MPLWPMDQEHTVRIKYEWIFQHLSNVDTKKNVMCDDKIRQLAKAKSTGENIFQNLNAVSGRNIAVGRGPTFTTKVGVAQPVKFCTVAGPSATPGRLVQQLPNMRDNVGRW